jgi:hypothetical protein
MHDDWGHAERMRHILQQENDRVRSERERDALINDALGALNRWAAPKPQTPTSAPSAYMRKRLTVTDADRRKMAEWEASQRTARRGAFVKNLPRVCMAILKMLAWGVLIVIAGFGALVALWICMS